MSRLMEIARNFQFDTSMLPNAHSANSGSCDKSDISDKRAVPKASAGTLRGEISEKREIRVAITPGAVPRMPRGIRLVEWNLKEPPVCLEVYSVVTDTEKFAMSTLGEIAKLMDNPRARVGWSMPQLLDRLAQVGVSVALDSGDGL